jgi:large subunit ribosomal protein L24
MPKKLNVKKGDTVVLLTGKKEYKKTPTGKPRHGKVLEVSIDEGKVIVEGFNMVTKHMKPVQNQPGGIVSVESPIYACKVQVVCPHCGKPTRVGHTTEAGDNGKQIKKRVCKKCNETF